MTNSELKDIISYLIEDAKNLCFACATPCVVRVNTWREPRPYGSTVAYEDCSEEHSFCPRCKETECHANLAQDLLDCLDNKKGREAITAGHLIWLAEVMEDEALVDNLAQINLEMWRKSNGLQENS